MAQTMGLDTLPDTPAVPLEAIALPESRLSSDTLQAVIALTAVDRVHTSAHERAFHARGKSYADLIQARAGALDPAPDAVVYPASADEVLALVQLAAREDIALVPFGGGSSVVGGVTPLRAEHRAVITLDLTLLDQLLEIDETARVARIQAGMYGPALEAALQARGYTLGHYPQSFQFSTLGGWIAARGAGQQSNKYGKAERWLVSARLATANGFWDTEGFPASAAGPQLTALVAGSEGALGVITEATVRIQPVPEVRDYRGYMFQTFAQGVAAARALVQTGVPTAMIRLSDEDETYFFNGLQHPEEAASITMRFCIMLVGIEGSAGHVEAVRAQSRALMEAHGGMHFGEDIGARWYENRFGMPYLRDPMLDRGLAVDTLETATRWSNVETLHTAVVEALNTAIATHPAAPGLRGTAFCHVSHTYPDGASLYFTFAFARCLTDPLAQWKAIKAAASEAILANGGTISHHHGVGTDHLPWMAREKGPVTSGLLQAIKREIDPQGIFNPGKLIP
jgi:alkyldihydroxyacetonephosphate synthase